MFLVLIWIFWVQPLASQCPPVASYPFNGNANDVSGNGNTPDGDGLNDLFIPVYTDLEDVTLQIFNRWGQLLFETDTPSLGWDGTFNGVPCPEGVYVCVVRHKEPLTEGERKKVGTVQVVRRKY